MNVISFDGFVFASNDFWTGIDYNAGRAQWSLIPNVQSRLNAPGLLTGSMITERPIPVNIGYSGASTYETAFNTLMGALDPMNPEPRTLVAQLNDGTNVSCEAVVILPGHATDENDVDVLLVTFLTTSPYWTEVTPSTDGPDTINAADPDTVIVNGGAVAVAPVITRSAPTVSFGTQTSRYRVSVTNSGLLPLERETMMVPAGTNRNWFKMIKDGTFYPVTDFRAQSTTWEDYHAFPATVDAGDTETFDLIETGTDPGFNLDTYTRLDGNYSAIDLGWELKTNITSSTTTVITVTGAGWTTNRWAGGSVVIVGGTGAGQARQVNTNGADTLTVTRAFTTTPDATSDIMLYGGGWLFQGGRASSSTSTVLTDSSNNFAYDDLTGATIATTGGTGSGQTRTITGNGATTITVSPAFSPTPDATTTYVVKRPGFHRYYVTQIKHSAAHRGGWQINKRFTAPSRTIWGRDILNGWEPFVMLQNGDDFNQLRWTKVNMGGSDDDYFPILNATRRRGQDRRLQEEGQGDGVAIYHPWGYSRMFADFVFTNPNGIAKAVVMGREAGGDEFEPYYENSTTYATATSVTPVSVFNLADYGDPVQIYMGLLPVDGVEIARTAAETDEANVKWGVSMILSVDINGKFSYSVAAVETVYPVDDEIRIGDYALQIGQRDGKRLYMKATGETLVLDCENARAWIDHGGGVTSDVTYAVTPVKYSGSSYTVADHWPVLEPGNNTVTCSGSPWASFGAFTLAFSFAEKIYG